MQGEHKTMLLIYTPRITNRVRYTFDLIFKTVLGVEYEITSDEQKFRQYSGAKISYSKKNISDELFYSCSNLLFETGIKNQTSLPSDPFALAFFLASRYEEYFPFQPDEYGRFSAKQSLSFKNNIIDKPVINLFAKELKEKIAARYPGFSFPKKRYLFQPTIDIDNAYAYIGKNLVRTLGGYARAAMKRDWDDFRRRKNVFAGEFSGKEKDPYDTYSFLREVHSKYNIKPIFFFLLGDWARHDKNLPHRSTRMQALIKNISSDCEIGIHPSFASNSRPEKVRIEKERLKKISEKEITRSRQHFLKLKFPETYRNLIASLITDDFTMGFADAIGFRAGICTPFRWYDLERESETNLTLHPFAVMDGTLNSYLKLSPAAAVEKTKEIINEVKKADGVFISIWHNETLSDWREWKGWKNVYEEIIKDAASY